MLTFRRLAVYTLLIIPLAYVMGITFADRRMMYYLVMGVFLAPVFIAFLLHEAARKKWPRYQRFLVEGGGWFRRLLPFAGKIALIMVMTVPTIILMPIGVGLTPWPFAALALLVLVWGIAQGWLKGVFPKWLRIDMLLVMIVAAYLAVFCMAWTFRGTPASACQALQDSPYLMPIITDTDIQRAPNVAACFPYDVKSDAAADKLFFTLKQKRSGFLKTLGGQRIANDAIGVTSFAHPVFDPQSLLVIRGDSTGRYPQRITVNPERREIYVVVLDINGNHAIRVISYDGGFRPKQIVPLRFEPIRAYFNNKRNELLVLGYEGDVAKFTLDSYRQTFTRHFDSSELGFIGMLDTLAPDRWGERYYASVVSSYFVMFDAGDFDILKKRDVGVPTIGLDYDRARNRVYAAATLTREILVLDGETLEVRDRIPTGTTVRELYLDRRRGLIVTAGYADGLLDFYDVETFRRRGRVFVGKLARGIHVEQQTGRVFVTSSCGLFEVKVDDLLANGV